MTGYNGSTGLYAAVDTKTGSQFQVPRIRLCFQAEDPALFARRLAHALANRTRAEAALRLALCVDNMPMDDIPAMDGERVSRVLELTLNNKKLRDKNQDTSRIVKDLSIQYGSAMNLLTFRRAKFGGFMDEWRVSVDDPVAILDTVDGPVDPVGGTSLSQRPPAAEELGHVQSYDFGESYSEFSFRSLLTNTQVLSALGKIKVENSKVLKMHMFNLFLNKVLRLEEFEQLQTQACDQVALYLKDTWTTTMKNVIKSTFRDVGKGWFNLLETKMETYEVSKLRKFLTLVKIMAEDLLRFLVEENLGSFVAVIRRSCDCDVSIRALNDVVTEPLDGASPAAAAASGPQLVSRIPPLFLIEMEIEDGRIVYQTPLSKVQPVVGAVFDHALASVQGIPQLEPQVMENLFWSSQPTFQTPHPMEEQIQAMRNELMDSLAGALVPVQAYLDKYKQFEDFLQTDIPAAIQRMSEADDFSLKVLLKEVQDASAVRDQWSELLPIKVQVGPVVIGTKRVREALLERKQRQINLLKDLCATIPKRMVLEASK